MKEHQQVKKEVEEHVCEECLFHDIIIRLYCGAPEDTAISRCQTCMGLYCLRGLGVRLSVVRKMAAVILCSYFSYQNLAFL